MKKTVLNILLLLAGIFSLGGAEAKKAFSIQAELLNRETTFFSGTEVKFRFVKQCPETYRLGAWNAFSYPKMVPAEFLKIPGVTIRKETVNFMPYQWGTDFKEGKFSTHGWPDGEYTIRIVGLYRLRAKAEVKTDKYCYSQLKFTLNTPVAPAPASPSEFVLCQQGKTLCTIVTSDVMKGEEIFALSELKQMLEKACGTPFRSVPSGKEPKYRRIFLGMSPAAVKAYGKNPVPELKSQEHCVVIKNGDLFLFGTGKQGTLNAVYDLLENVLGFRWYDARYGMKVPDCRNCILKDLNRKNDFKVRSRKTIGYWNFYRPHVQYFLIRNRENQKVYVPFADESRIPASQLPEDELRPAYPSSHGLPSHIPSKKINQSVYRPLSFLKDKDYSVTNPEFFAMDSTGKRTFHSHLCLTNPGLRKELAKNALENMRRNPNKDVFDLSFHDSDTRCACPDCVAMEKKYGSFGGPLFDFILHFAPQVKKEFPGKMISFLAYRKCQTEKPPQIDVKFPDNVLVVFAPIDDDFGKDWNHPRNQETREHLIRWGRIAKNLSVWYYPNPYSGEITPALGNINRLVNDIRIMTKAGMSVSYFEHNVGTAAMTGWTDLQTWLICQLFQDPDRDAEKLIREFFVFEYGPAAPLVWKYWKELEEATSKTTNRMTWNAAFNSYTHLTPDNLFRWNGYFDQMAERVKNNPRQAENLARLRINLDLPLLRHYKRVCKAHPEFKVAPDVLEKRIRDTFELCIRKYYSKGAGFRADSARKFLYGQIGPALLQAKGNVKPLPKEIFDRYDPEKMEMVLPFYTGSQLEKDPDGAWGVAAVFRKPEPGPLPFVTAFYDTVYRKYRPDIGQVTEKNLGPPGKYKFYPMADVTVSQDCELEMGIWRFKANCGGAFTFGTHNRCKVYASLKFQGPKYYPEQKDLPNAVFCDRVVVIRTE